MQPILQLKNVTKAYKDFTLDGVSFDLPPGIVLGMIGENGAGKSTTISAILDMIGLTEGSIKVFGMDHKKDGPAVREKIGTVIDGMNQIPYFYIKDVEKIYKNAYKNWDSEKFYTLLKQFKLPQDKQIKTFSKGMNVKLNFAAALSHNPDLLLLDEATSGLDPVMRDEILETLQDYMAEGERSILLSTHITSDLDKIADYILFIHEGKVRFLKSKEEIEENYGILTCGEETLKALTPEDYDAYIKNAFSFRVLISNKKELTDHIKGLNIERASVEDIMLFYIKGVLPCED